MSAVWVRFMAEKGAGGCYSSVTALFCLAETEGKGTATTKENYVHCCVMHVSEAAMKEFGVKSEVKVLATQD